MSSSPSSPSPHPSLPHRLLAHLTHTAQHNLHTLRTSPLLETSGAFGDLGTFAPIFIALTTTQLISAPSTLFFSGLANILTGALFGLPLPVQPMKAIASVALSSPAQFSPAEVASGGLFVAGAVGLFALTGLLEWFCSAVPVPVVKGIQVGAGVSLAVSGFGFLGALLRPELGSGDERWRYGVDVALFCATLLLLLACTMRPRLPFVLILIAASAGTCLIWLFVTNIGVSGSDRYLGPHFGLWQPATLVPRTGEFVSGALGLGLGQLPLTTLNSVLAVVVLAQDLFPRGSTGNPGFSPPGATAVGLSVSIMNLVAVWFGSMPFCHGSGGLAAQYRFGARSGASVMILGALKLVLGLFASEFVVAWCKALQGPVLGVLVFVAGVELAKMGENLNGAGAKDLWIEVGDGVLGGEARRGQGELEEEVREDGRKRVFRGVDDEERMKRWVVMLVTVAAILGAKNDGVGFVAGMVVHWAYGLKEWAGRTWGWGSIRLGG